MRGYGVRAALRNVEGSVVVGRSLTCPSPNSMTRQIPSARSARSTVTKGRASELISGVKQVRSISGGRSSGVPGYGPAGGEQAVRLVNFEGGVVPLVDQPVVFGVPVQAAQRGDQVLLGAAAAPPVAPLHRVGMAASRQGERYRQLCRRQGRPQACSRDWQTCLSGTRGGDFPPLRATRTWLDHAIRRIHPERGKVATACSSGARFGEISPIWVSEDQGLPIGHGSEIALTSTFAVAGAR